MFARSLRALALLEARNLDAWSPAGPGWRGAQLSNFFAGGLSAPSGRIEGTRWGTVFLYLPRRS